jgi:hypothetical protein
MDNLQAFITEERVIHVLYPTNTSNPPICNPPVLVSQSSNYTNVVGSTFQLFGNFNGTAPLSYKWYRNNELISDETSNIILLTGVEGVNVFRVTSSNDCGLASSGGIYVAITNIPPTPPTLILNPVNSLTSRQSNNTIILDWADNSTGEDRYEIEMSYKIKNRTYPYVKISTVSSNSTSFVYYPQNRNVNYSFRIRAAKSIQYAPYSNISTIRFK